MHTPWIGIMVAPLTILLGFVLKPIHFKLDLSFGLFLFHMVVVGMLLHFGIGGVFGIIITAVFTPFLALVSVFLIEKPCSVFKA